MEEINTKDLTKKIDLYENNLIDEKEIPTTLIHLNELRKELYTSEVSYKKFLCLRIDLILLKWYGRNKLEYMFKDYLFDAYLLLDNLKISAKIDKSS